MEITLAMVALNQYKPYALGAPRGGCRPLSAKYPRNRRCKPWVVPIQTRPFPLALRRVGKFNPRDINYMLPVKFPDSPRFGTRILVSGWTPGNFPEFVSILEEMPLYSARRQGLCGRRACPQPELVRCGPGLLPAGAPVGHPGSHACEQT